MSQIIGKDPGHKEKMYSFNKNKIQTQVNMDNIQNKIQTFNKKKEQNIDTINKNNKQTIGKKKEDLRTYW